jgi:hypothetical protein
MFLRSADTDDARWLKLLSRVALLLGVFTIGVFAIKAAHSRSENRW